MAEDSRTEKEEEEVAVKNHYSDENCLPDEDNDNDDENFPLRVTVQSSDEEIDNQNTDHDHDDDFLLRIMVEELVIENHSVSDRTDCSQDKENVNYRNNDDEDDDNDDDDSDDDYDDDDDDDDDDDYEEEESDHALNKQVLNRLLNRGDDSDPSSELASLTGLCDILSFLPEGSLRGPRSTSITESLAPFLIESAKRESSPDVMLYAIRAISYLCEAAPACVGVLVKLDVVSVLCGPVMAIHYLDLAEECLQGLEKISRHFPLECLESGVVMAVLSYIDFFSTGIQRVGITIIANICKGLPSDSSSQLMEAVPLLCNLLHYEDQKLVENVATCLIRIVKMVNHSSEMMEELCKHGLVHQVAQHISLNSGNILSQPIYTGLIELLTRLVSGSIIASNTLFEQNIGSTLKHILCSDNLLESKSYSPIGSEAHTNQTHEVMKLLNVLLPPLPTNGENNIESTDKERTVTHQPEAMRRFAADILPVVVQVVSSGADLYVCYGCLSVINKVVYFSRSNMLVDLLNSINISSFLAGIIARKNKHLLMLALKIVNNVMQEFRDAFLESFTKEGIVYALDALVNPDKCSKLMLQVSSNTQLLSGSTQKVAASNDALRCLCYAYNIDHPSPSEIEKCKLEDSAVQTLAKHIMTTYFTTESRFGLTSVLQKLRDLCATLSDMVDMSTKDGNCEREKMLTYILGQIMQELNGEEPISTFEFIESGIVRSLVAYLSNGCYQNGKVDPCDLKNHFDVLQKRYEVFVRFCLSSSSHNWKNVPLAILARKLQSALSLLENFPVILHHDFKPRKTYATIPSERSTIHPCLKVHFIKGADDETLCDYSSDVVNVEAFTSMDAVESYLWPKVNTNTSEDDVESSATVPNEQGKTTISSSTSTSQKCVVGKESLAPSSNGVTQRLMFSLDGRQLDGTLTLYQAILQLKMEMKTESDSSVGRSFWNQEYEIVYRKRTEQIQTNIQDFIHKFHISTAWNHPRIFWQNTMCFSSMLFGEVPSSFESLSPIHEILILLKVLEVLNKSASHLVSCERSSDFAEGHNNSLDGLMVTVCTVPQTEFVSLRLTEKLEKQMQESSVMSTGSMPSWCVQLLEAFPFLFSFQARCRYFQLTSFGSLHAHLYSRAHSSNNSNDRRLSLPRLPREKFTVFRNSIMKSAEEIMGSAVCNKAILEVEYPEEVGTGLGPTMEFFTLVSLEFQKAGLGMWREDHSVLSSMNGLETGNSGYVASPFGLFPRPWSSLLSTSNERELSEVIKKFVLLGQVVAKALQDGRVLDLSLSVPIYKLILGQELNLYDIYSFDPGFGRALIEFQALLYRKKVWGSDSRKNEPSMPDLHFWDTRIEDLSLDFTLPGYPDYMLSSVHADKMVDISNLEEYISLTADATLNSGILRQVEAFKSGFNQVLPLRSIQIFTVEELDQLLCGERSAWNYNELLEVIKFDHGYTASSRPIINLLEIMQEFDSNQQKAFLKFVTGAPRLPPGGLVALSPKFTIVRKDCNGWADGALPSVMTCANYLKLPPYSSKEIMRERVMYAITEGQGSFHLS